MSYILPIFAFRNFTTNDIPCQITFDPARAALSRPIIQSPY